MIERLVVTLLVLVDIVVVAAIKLDSVSLWEMGEFRADLFYRLNIAG